MMKKFYCRKFLNMRGHNAGAYVIADIKTENHHNKATAKSPAKDWKTVDAGLTISDCSRIVTLDFYAGTFDMRDRGELTNALFKARTLRQVVNEFTDALEEAVKELDSE